jgi:hypothetical protein
MPSISSRQIAARTCRPGALSSALLSIAAVGTLSLACVNFSSSATLGTTLPRDVIVPITAVVRHFPDIARETSTGRNLTATGEPKATLMVVYTIDAGPNKVTITVDQYRSPHDALSAYRQAVQKSKSIPGFKLVPVANIGQQTFASAVTIDAETHIGLGLLNDVLIVGASWLRCHSRQHSQARCARPHTSCLRKEGRGSSQPQTLVSTWPFRGHPAR